mmetsp:Transcript_82548/g.266215  ORF Transcript_82548/g.266215 Transcript_82548/m.266215 type:complete len:214 (+) Transcript_82548:1739-2380(+)
MRLFKSGMVWNFASETLFKSRRVSANCIWTFALLNLFFASCTSFNNIFSNSYFERIGCNFSSNFDNSDFISSNLSQASAFSAFPMAIASTSKSKRFCSKRSNASGFTDNRMLTFAHASSMASTAFAGRNSTDMYLSVNIAAATSAASCTFTPWCAESLSRKACKMATVAFTLGSRTRTCWKQRSKDLSFSKCCRWPSRVVAPMQRTSSRTKGS